MQTTARRYAITLAGRCPATLRELIATRFDAVRPGAGSDVLVVNHLDQAGLRALLVLIWDAGESVVSVSSTSHNRG